MKAERRGAASWDALLIGPLFLGVAAFIWFKLDEGELPVGGGTSVHSSQIDISARRVPLVDPPMILLNGFERTCMDCHRVFPPRDIAPEDL